MKFFLGLFVGVLAAVGIAVGAAWYALEDIRELARFDEDRDRTGDETRTLDLADFDRLELAGVFEADVSVGEGFSVTVSGPVEELDRLDARVADGVLRLDTPDRGPRKWKRRQGITAHIGVPSLSKIDVSGVVDADIAGVDAEAFSASISGVGDMTLSGRCGSLSADVSGVGDLDAEDLRCEDVRVEVSGVGSASVYASKRVSASVSGIGDIDVAGSPAETETKSGFFSDITIR